jgi:putative phosphotransacetylase
MDEPALKRLIRNTVLVRLTGYGLRYVPAAVSARHIHLCEKDRRILFGPETALRPLRGLSQPGQFAAEQTLDLAGPKGVLGKVRVLGPERDRTQVEVSVSDCYVLGIKPVIRMSGNTGGSPGCTLTGPAGRVELSEGVIVAARHVHMSQEQAAAYGVKNGGLITLKVPPPREGLMGGIVVRAGEGHDLELHLDTDEANGNHIENGAFLEFWDGVFPEGAGAVPGRAGAVSGEPGGRALDLVTERDVNEALDRGLSLILCTEKGFISPAAADRAKEKGIVIRRLLKRG